jgi:LysM repeat protein
VTGIRAFIRVHVDSSCENQSDRRDDWISSPALVMVPLMRGLLPLLLWAVLSTPDAAWAKARSSSRPATSSARSSHALTHTVYAGQTLGMIAKRYNVSVEALCAANAISRRSPIKPGQKLLVPDKNAVGEVAPVLPQAAAAGLPRASVTKTDVVAAAAKLPAERSRAKSEPRNTSWRKYTKPARRAGYVVLKATGRSWQGYALVKGNRIAPAAHKGLKRALYSWRTGAETEIDPRLVRILVKVSDTFGGRPLRIVSGYREHSYAKESKHRLGRACDLSVEGVPNEALRDYLLTLDQVGVGYYPNSSFVHVDVRSQNTQWVDRSSAGERPDYDHDAGAP